MDKKYLIIGVIGIVVIAAIVFFFGFFQQGPQNFEGSQCDVEEGEWVPQQGECQNNQSLQNQCNEFCSNHPDCCPGWSGNYTSSLGGPGEILLPLPSNEEVAELTRNYVTTIKAINEGPNIYSISGPPSIISDDELDKMKDIGFNTVQVLFIGKRDKNTGVYSLNEVNNRVLINDIIAIKKKGLAVWIALDIAGGPSDMKADLGSDYETFKENYLKFISDSAELMEKYKVEYFTANNEPDKPFKEQTSWGANEQIEKDLVDFLPAANLIAREKFNGKLINKITGPRLHTEEMLTASFQNVDIAGVDVGPFIGNGRDLTEYTEQFNDYQFYATKADSAGVPWMNAEYWQGDFEVTPTQFVKENELIYANVSFNVYLETIPRGVGYVWNEMSMFSLQPKGEKTRLAIKDFFGKI